jgi:anti-sigma regulatory factor (Ser/Thr protein kinase)
MRRRLEGWLVQRDVDQADIVDVILAVSEACNNAIEHAYRDNGGGPINVTVAKETEKIRAVVEDHGTWRDQTTSDERGRGLMLIRQLMDSADLETGLNGTRVTFTRQVGPEREATVGYASATPGAP